METGKRFVEANTGILIRWNVQRFMTPRSRDHEKRYRGYNVRFFSRLQVASRVSRFRQILKSSTNISRVGMSASWVLSTRKTIFELHLYRKHICSRPTKERRKIKADAFRSRKYFDIFKLFVQSERKLTDRWFLKNIGAKFGTSESSRQTSCNPKCFSSTFSNFSFVLHKWKFKKTRLIMLLYTASIVSLNILYLSN